MKDSSKIKIIVHSLIYILIFIISFIGGICFVEARDMITVMYPSGGCSGCYYRVPHCGDGLNNHCCNSGAFATNCDYHSDKGLYCCNIWCDGAGGIGPNVDPAFWSGQDYCFDRPVTEVSCPSDYYVISGANGPLAQNYCTLYDYPSRAVSCTASPYTQATAGICEYISGCYGSVSGTVNDYPYGTNCGGYNICNGAGVCFHPNYRLSVKNDGGDGTISSDPSGIDCGEDCSKTFPSGTDVTLSVVPAEGYIFTGWSSTTGNFCLGTGDCVIHLTKAERVTANYAPINHVLTFNRVGATGSGKVVSFPPGIDCGDACSINVKQYRYGTNVTLIPLPSQEYNFTGWSSTTGDSCHGTENCTITMNSDKNLTARFIIKQYNLSFYKVGDSSSANISSNPAGIDCGSACSTKVASYNSSTFVSLAAILAQEHRIIGWGGGCNGVLDCSVKMNIPKSVSVTVDDVQYNLSFFKVGGPDSGNVTSTSNPAQSLQINCKKNCDSNSTLYNSGTNVTLTAIPSPEYNFIGWSGACTGSDSCIVQMNANKSVNAIFAKCRSPMPSWPGVLINVGTPTQLDQIWAYNDTPPYSDCSWRCDSANNYVRNGTTDSCKYCTTSETICDDGIDNDCNGEWDYDTQTWFNGVSYGSPYHTKGDTNCKVKILGGIVPTGKICSSFNISCTSTVPKINSVVAYISNGAIKIYCDYIDWFGSNAKFNCNIGNSPPDQNYNVNCAINLSRSYQDGSNWSATIYIEGCEPRCNDSIVGNTPGEECDNGTSYNGVACNPPYNTNCSYCSNNCKILNITGQHCGDLILNKTYETCEIPDDCSVPPTKCHNSTHINTSTASCTGCNCINQTTTTYCGIDRFCDMDINRCVSVNTERCWYLGNCSRPDECCYGFTKYHPGYCISSSADWATPQQIENDACLCMVSKAPAKPLNGTCRNTGDYPCWNTNPSQPRCCGNTIGENWSTTVSTDKIFEDILIEGYCLDGKWLSRNDYNLTKYNLWVS